MKKLFILLLALMISSSFFVMTASAGLSDGDTPTKPGDIVNVAWKGDYLSWVKVDGVGQSEGLLIYTYYNYKNPATGAIEERPVYCASPDLPGVKDALGGNKAENDPAKYKVMQFLQDKDDVMYWIMACGYPCKTLAELGLSTPEQGYSATKSALWAYIGMFPSYYGPSGPGEDGIRAGASGDSATSAAVVAAAKAIYREAMSKVGSPIPAGGPVMFYLDPLDYPSTQPYILIGTLNEVFFDEHEEPEGGSLRVVKADENGMPLNGAHIRIRHVESGAEYTGVTLGNGTVTFSDIPTGVFEISELAAPAGYIIDPNKYTINILPLSETGRAESVTLINRSKPGLRIIKIDSATSMGIAGVVFEVYKDGALYGEYVTNQSGLIVLTDLPSGTFIAREKSTVPPYVLDKTAQWIELDPGDGIKTLVFLNESKSGIRLIKLDSATLQPIANARFRIRQVSGGSYNQELLSSETGEIDLAFLDPGVFEIVELSVPEPYLIDEGARIVEILPGKPDARFVFLNSRKPSLEIIKYDPLNDVYLPGTSFRISRIEDASHYLDRVSGQDGRIYIEGLSPGVWSVVEQSANSAYVKNTTEYHVQLFPGRTSTLVVPNYRKPDLQIVKTDANSAEPISGATFTVRKADSATVSTVVTGEDGAWLYALDPGVYEIIEQSVPEQWLLDSTPQLITLTAGRNAVARFQNYRKPSLIVWKYDEQTATPLPNAEFSISKKGGAVIHEGVTGSGGFLRLDNIDDGWVTITEIAPPPGWLLANPASRDVFLEPGKVVEVKFDNLKCPTLTIVKTDSVTGDPIPGVKFDVRFSPAANFTGGVVDLGTFVTDSAGRIFLDNNLQSGFYRATELEAVSGYAMKDPVTQDIFLAGGDNKTLYYENIPLSALIIRKIDSATGLPVAGATFEIRYLGGTSGSGGTLIKTAVTSINGSIVLTGLQAGTYVCEEKIPAQGFQLSNPSVQTAYISGKDQDVVELVFSNPKMGHLVITKLDSVTKMPIASVTFLVTDSSGAVIGPNNGEYTTDASGVIEITEWLPIGSTVNVKEIRGPDTHNMDAAPQSVKIMENTTHRLTFYNTPKSGLQIVKIDADTKQPLSHAWFAIYKMSGDLIGEYETNSDGLIILDKLSPSWLKIVEIRSPDGYLLDDTPKDVEITNNQFLKVVFENRKVSGLQIKKIDSSTRQPVENVEFSIAKMNGERIGSYKTDKNGLIYVSLEPGWYTVVEEKADGYILDAAPRSVEITTGSPLLLEIENTPMSGLLIVKTDERTGEPLQGVVFDVMRADGQRVTGNITDGNQPGTEANSPNKTVGPNGDISGSYTTDASGRILINSLPAGEYHVVERKALDSYELDTNVYSVTVTPNKLATLQLTNREKAGLRIIKIDSISKKPIYNVEFMVFDSNNKVVGTFYTDNNGVIDFAGILPEGRYTLRETRPDSNYYPDDVPRTVEFKSGHVTEIRWENTPKLAQIQILKKSGDDNEVNGLPAGTPLAGAIFEVYEYKSGNLVDRFVSGANGWAVSKPVPLGRYIVKEVQSPQWYKLSSQTLDIDLEFATQIVKMEFLNYSANTGVYIKKTGVAECMPGDTIRYDIRAVQNTSTVPLTDFFWRDTLPTDAVRLSKIVTGTFNQSLRYKVMITTNKGDARVIADNLSTTQNNVIDCSSASLGLKNDEYVTSVTFLFGTVKAGFAQVVQPQIFVKVLDTLQNGYEFANKADMGGKYGNEWVVGNSTWLTKVFKKTEPLPRTGY